jgi:dihydroorotate dehydrogenase
LIGYRTLRPLLFRLEPEKAHAAGIAALRMVQQLPSLRGLVARAYRSESPALRQVLFGQDFANPVGIAAGFDKNAEVVDALPTLGFGFVEIGTVTPLGQPGNPKPRMFRHSEAESLRNALGFNNRGMEAMRERLEGRARGQTHSPVPLGINLGKNKETPAEEALLDYEVLLRGLEDLADYLVINLSSPNTPGLRDLQNEAFLRDLLTLARGITVKPILVKISPDLDPEAAADLGEVAVEAGASGLIATNTTIEYGLLPEPLPPSQRFGGLSGDVLREKSFRLFQAVARRLFGRTTLISVGGIDSGAEAYRRIKAGASLVQIYTALVYQGPGLPKRINDDLLELMARDGVRSITEVVGVETGAA